MATSEIIKTERTEEPEGRWKRRAQLGELVSLINGGGNEAGDASDSPRTWPENLEDALRRDEATTEMLSDTCGPTFTAIKELWTKAKFYRGQLDAYQDTPEAPDFWLNQDPYEENIGRLQKLLGEEAAQLEISLEPDQTHAEA
jgi:hypothetical protein